jgi:nitrogen-specific signal transduction histidine kinase/CheY-like chemotaxis protein
MAPRGCDTWLERASTKLQQEVEARTRELLDAQDALARSERLAGLGRLAAGVAHEINNPIAVVQHNLEKLRDGDSRGLALPAGTYRHVEGALSATYRIVRVVRQLLDAGRAVGPDNRRLEAFRIAPGVRRAISMTALGAAGVSVTTDISEQLTARGDADLCAQVIENLLITCAHALEMRSRGRVIHIRADRLDQRVRIFVADNGPGIPEEIRPRLFEPFVSTKAVGKGSGLGLAVSHGLMRAQEGELMLVQSSGAGTEMGLELPWCAADELTAPVAPAPVSIERSSLTLLIVDDDDDMREMLHDATQDFFEVETAATIDEAFKRIHQLAKVDVVLCDLMMPDGGADEWLEQCATAHPLLVDRTIIITGGPTTPEAAALTDARRDRVLYEPFALADMREMVMRLAYPGDTGKS